MPECLTSCIVPITGAALGVGKREGTECVCVCGLGEGRGPFKRIPYDICTCARKYS